MRCTKDVQKMYRKRMTKMNRNTEKKSAKQLAQNSLAIIYKWK